MRLLLPLLFIVGLNATSDVWAVQSFDDLLDVCNYSAVTPKEQRVIDATAMIVQSGRLFYNASNDTYSVESEPFTEHPVSGEPICSYSHFYGETTANWGKSGFLIAQDQIITAPHGPAPDPDNFMVVFRDLQGGGGPNDPGCMNFKWTEIPPENVYEPISILSNTWDSSWEYDYAVIELDRPVVGRLPLKIRRSGAPREGDIVVLPGYPMHTAEKIDTAGVYVGMDEDGGYLLTNLHPYSGSSGSPVYNLNDDVVEAAISSSINGIGLAHDADLDCLYAKLREGSYVTNGPIRDVQDQIPRHEVLVEPLDQVVHVLDLHPTTDLFSDSYNITSAIPSGGETIDISPITGPVGSPSAVPVMAMSISPGTYSVPAGQPGMQLTVLADVQDLNTCGAWDFEINVHDSTNDLDNIIRHRFEVGLREYVVEPEDDWTVNDIGSPYIQTKTYTLRNIRPTPTHVAVSPDGTLPDSNLILIDGSAGFKTFDLGPVGSASESATFTLSINASVADAKSLNTVYTGRIAIYNQPFNCSVGYYKYRYVHFKRGEQKFVSSTPLSMLPGPAGGEEFGKPYRFDFDLSNEGDFCVGDIDLDLGFLGFYFGIVQSLPYVKIELTAPDGRTGVLWDRQAYPGDNYEITDIFPDINPGPVPLFHLDDAVSPPLGSTSLSYFNLSDIAGHWYVDVSTDLPNSFIVAGPARLDITRSQFCLGTGL